MRNSEIMEVLDELREHQTAMKGQLDDLDASLFEIRDLLIALLARDEERDAGKPAAT